MKKRLNLNGQSIHSLAAPLNTSRRTLMKALLALGISGPLLTSLLHAATQNNIMKRIPSSGEEIPVIGIGTSLTFNALGKETLIQQLTQVLQIFFNQGGTLIDSSPMYGTSEAVTGQLLKHVQANNTLFAATKVWTDGQKEGIEQMEASRKKWGVKRFDLIQIHNLRDWQVHLETLKTMKAEGQIRYIGITTSHGRYHNELETLLKKYPFDFIQLSYNILNRKAEKRLLPLAQERGIAVIANRHYEKGDLFRMVKNKSLPNWASDIDVSSWGQFFLKYIVSHPAVTCAIPATNKVKHMLDNMAAQFGRLPDAKMRQQMFRYFQS